MQEFPFNTGTLKSQNVCYLLFLLYINNLDDFVFKIAIYTECTTLYSKFYSTNDLHRFTRYNI